MRSKPLQTRAANRGKLRSLPQRETLRRDARTQGARRGRMRTPRGARYDGMHPRRVLRQRAQNTLRGDAYLVRCGGVRPSRAVHGASAKDALRQRRTPSTSHGQAGAHTDEKGRSMLTITTTNNLDGYEVVEYLGIVTGEAVSGINMFRDIGAGLRNVFGGRSAGYEDEMSQAREEVLNEMSQRAEALGANAVIGASVGYETFSEMIMTTACGTAVRVRRKA